MRLVVTFTIDVGAERTWIVSEDRPLPVDVDDLDEAVDLVCALLPAGAEDVVIVSEAARDRVLAERVVTCSTCAGSGLAGEVALQECWDCGGTGRRAL